VSVVIPVRDGNEWLPDAIASVLGQSYGRIEVLVVDDGSSAAPDALLPLEDPRVRLVRQEPSGAATARNRGVREATGVLVHFLDADDVMDPLCLERKVQALRLVPDATLCVSSYRATGANLAKDATTHRPPELGDALCPTRDLLRTATNRYSFHTSTVLAARHALIDAGPMEERFSHGEDSRYWFQLGLRGNKVVAIHRALATRRFVETGLSADLEGHRRSWTLVALANLRDLLAEPLHWGLLGSAARRALSGPQGAVAEESEAKTIAEQRDRVLRAVAEMPEAAAAQGLSALPALAVLRTIASRPRDSEAALLSQPLIAAAEEAMRRSGPPSRADVQLWLGHECSQSFCHSLSAFHELVAWVEEGLSRGRSVVSRDELDELARRVPNFNLERRWARALRFSRVLGPGLSVWGTRTWDEAAAGTRVLVRQTRSRVRLRSRLRELRATSRRTPAP
jgi:GT2 family glycosyltransferase